MDTPVTPMPAIAGPITRSELRPGYLIPSAFDERVVSVVAAAVRGLASDDAPPHTEHPAAEVRA